MTTRPPRTDALPLGADGEFCWMDLKTRDIAGTAALFSAVLGWRFTVDHSDWRRATVITVGDHRIGTVSDLSSPVYPPGTPPHVAYYLAVDDVDGRVAAAVVDGARLLVEPFDAADQGRIATLVDPFGTPVSLWRPADGHGWRHPAAVPTAPHRMILTSPQPSETRRFYQETLGAGLHHSEVIQAVGGSVEPAAWELVVTVDDLDVVADRATRSGGGLATPAITARSLRTARRLSTVEGITVYVEPATDRGHPGASET